MGFFAMADQIMWPPSLSRDRRRLRVTKCRHSRVAGLRLEGNLVVTIIINFPVLIFCCYMMWHVLLCKNSTQLRILSTVIRVVFNWQTCRWKMTKDIVVHRFLSYCELLCNHLSLFRCCWNALTVIHATSCQTDINTYIHYTHIHIDTRPTLVCVSKKRATLLWRWLRQIATDFTILSLLKSSLN